MKAGTFPPVLSCFGMTQKQIAAGLTCVGQPPPELERMAPPEAALALESAMSGVLVPSMQMVEMAETLIADIKQHYAENYASALMLRQGLNKNRSPPQRSAITMLTGLAGTGKSVFIRRLLTLISEELLIDPGLGFSQLAFNPVRSVQFDSGGSNKASLMMISKEEFLGRFTASQALDLIRQELYRCGVGLLIVDELQFRSTGSIESRATINLLKQILQIDVPFTYVTNFSLAHKICRNPQEISNRLVRRPMVLRPPDPDESCLEKIFAEYGRVSSGAIPQDPIFRRRVYERTFGLHRNRIVLLKNAYLRARRRGALVVSLADVEAAYNSADFFVFRTDVEDLHRIVMGGTTSRLREDLLCPFGVDLGLAPSAADVANEVKTRKVEQQAALSSLRPDEKAILVKAQKSGGVATPKKKSAAGRPPKSLLQRFQEDARRRASE